MTHVDVDMAELRNQLAEANQQYRCVQNEFRYARPEEKFDLYKNLKEARTNIRDLKRERTTRKDSATRDMDLLAANETLRKIWSSHRYRNGQRRILL